jgi:hypothetical protein
MGGFSRETGSAPVALVTGEVSRSGRVNISDWQLVIFHIMGPKRVLRITKFYLRF